MRCADGWTLYRKWCLAAAEALRKGVQAGVEEKALTQFQRCDEGYQATQREYIQHLAGCDQCKSAIRAIPANPG